jgi:two-component system, cell cycle sensor histidine kinase and response regulator CckA
MNKELRILMLEDIPTDAELAERELRKAGIAFIAKRVETEKAFVEALEDFAPDIILADYSLPSFNGLKALAITRESHPDIPFIFATGTLGEEIVVETLKKGATDYVLKNGLSRLSSSVRRALREAEDRKEREHSEEALRESEAFNRAVLGSLNSRIAVLDKEGLIIAINEAWKKFNQESCVPVFQADIGQNYLEVCRQKSRPFATDTIDALKGIQAVLDGSQSQFSMEYPCHSETKQYWFLMNVTPLARKRGGAVVSHINITDHKQLQEQFLQSQKMDAIGRLAGGVAHDFNNLLTAIIGYSQILLRSFAEDNPHRHELEEIEKAGSRAAALTSQLLAFSRKQVLQARVLDLDEVVANMENMLRRLIGENIELKTSLESRTAFVKTDPGQIEQVIMNLVVNARDAMQHGGKLLIETQSVVLDENYPHDHINVKPGRYVMLAVSDSGCGMDPETQAHMFDPFFTTKEQGKGTGLGLSTVYGIVKQSNGHIWVYSEPGQGTTFKIYLPRFEDVADHSLQNDNAAVLPRGTETVLLVEDETPVRQLATRVLSRQGYTVLEATNGEEALRLAQEQAAREIHLLMTDVVMPQKGGKVLATELQKLRPEMKILFVSGYTDDAVIHNGVLNNSANFLQKPFTLYALTQKVREVLDAPGQDSHQD